MPCYNSEAYVADAIESVINQKYQNWELIIVNDGSTDDTKNILRLYSDKESRIIILEKKNGGYATAINYGLKRITGDYFLFMGSDDEIHCDLLSEIEKQIETCTPDLIGFRAVKKYKNGKSEIDKVTCYNHLIFESGMRIKEFENKYGKLARIFFTRDTAKIYKTDILDKLELLGKYGVDSDGIFATMFSHRCNSFMLTPIDGYMWTIRDDSVSATRSIEKEYDRQSNWINYVEYVCSLDSSTLSQTEKEYMWCPIKAGYDILSKKRHLTKEDYVNQMAIRKRTIKAMQSCGVDLNVNPIKRFMLNNSTYIWGWLMIIRNRFIRPIFLFFMR